MKYKNIFVGLFIIFIGVGFLFLLSLAENTKNGVEPVTQKSESGIYKIDMGKYNLYYLNDYLVDCKVFHS